MSCRSGLVLQTRTLPAPKRGDPQLSDSELFLVGQLLTREYSSGI